MGAAPAAGPGRGGRRARGCGAGRGPSPARDHSAAARSPFRGGTATTRPPRHRCGARETRRRAAPGPEGRPRGGHSVEARWAQAGGNRFGAGHAARGATGFARRVSRSPPGWSQIPGVRGTAPPTSPAPAAHCIHLGSLKKLPLPAPELRMPREGAGGNLRFQSSQVTPQQPGRGPLG